MRNDQEKTTVTGGIRKMTARWVITAEMVLESAAHFGGAGNDVADMEILRDPKEGLPLLPGTSLAGAMRSHLADILGGFWSDEHSNVAGLFGAARGDDSGSQSPLIIFDSLGRLPQNCSIEIRDGVAIDPAMGTAEAHKKFDMEVLPKGTVFPLRVELIVSDLKSEGELVSLLIYALKGISDGEISLGMRRSRGLGKLTARKWKALRYDLTTKQGWLKWLASDHLNPINENIKEHETPDTAVKAAYPSLVLKEFDNRRRRVVAELDLRLEGDLIVRSPATDANAPDAVHLKSAGDPVMPGTSVAGALRSQALRIARLVREAHSDADLWVDRMFGPRLEEVAEVDVSGQEKAHASRLRISEFYIMESTTRRQTRIAVDRFTGGVIEGALFDEGILTGGSLRIHLELRNPTDGETGLLLLLIRDLLSGEIPVGGGSAVGRGVLTGKARIRLADGTECEIGDGLSADDETLKKFNEYIEALAKAELLSSREEKHEWDSRMHA